MVFDVSSRTPQRPRPERGRHVEGGADAVVVVVDQHDDVHLAGAHPRERLGSGHRVAAVRRDQPVRHRAEPATAPPGGLRVGGHADRAGDVGGVAVAGLDAIVVVPRREVEDRLAAGRVHDLAHVRRDQRAPREAAEERRLEVAEQPVVALDRHHGLPRRDLVAVVEGAHVERVPAVDPLAVRALAARALAQDRDRLVHAAQHGVLALEDLQQDRRVVAVLLEDALRVVEVRVGVVPVADLQDRQVEDLTRESRPAVGRAHVAGMVRGTSARARRSAGRAPGRGR